MKIMAMAALLSLGAWFHAGSLSYEKEIVVPCEKGVSQVVSYHFPETVTDTRVYAISTAEPWVIARSPVNHQPGRSFTWKVPFTGSDPAGQYTAQAYGWNGKSAHYSPDFAFTVYILACSKASSG